MIRVALVLESLQQVSSTERTVQPERSSPPCPGLTQRCPLVASWLDLLTSVMRRTD